MAKTKSTRLSDDLDVTIARNWNDFLNKSSKLFECTDELVVDLAFESSLDEHTHYHFDTDEIVFPSDIFISSLFDIRFAVPYGNRTKSFSIKESELINGKDDSGKFILKDKIEAIFKEAFLSHNELIPDIYAFQDIVRKEPKFVEVLNDTDFFLKQYALALERKAKYSKLDFYGIF